MTFSPSWYSFLTLERRRKASILTPNIKISNSGSPDSICIQGNDTWVSLSQLVNESGNEVSLQVTSKRIKGYVRSDNVFNLSKKCLMKSNLKCWKMDWTFHLHLI